METAESTEQNGGGQVQPVRIEPLELKHQTVELCLEIVAKVELKHQSTQKYDFAWN